MDQLPPEALCLTAPAADVDAVTAALKRLVGINPSLVGWLMMGLVSWMVRMMDDMNQRITHPYDGVWMV